MTLTPDLLDLYENLKSDSSSLLELYSTFEVSPFNLFVYNQRNCLITLPYGICFMSNNFVLQNVQQNKSHTTENGSLKQLTFCIIGLPKWCFLSFFTTDVSSSLLLAVEYNIFHESLGIIIPLTGFSTGLQTQTLCPV